MAGMTLDELRSQLSGINQYQGEDEATLRARAEAAYAPQYQQNLTDLRNTLTQQLAAQNRSALSNGMQRSSYNQAQQASLRTGGLQAEAQLGAQYQGNVGQALLNLMEAEKDRKQNADNQRDALLLQLYNLTPKSSGPKKDDSDEDKDEDKDNDKDLEDLLGGLDKPALPTSFNWQKDNRISTKFLTDAQRKASSVSTGALPGKSTIFPNTTKQFQ